MLTVYVDRKSVHMHVDQQRLFVDAGDSHRSIPLRQIERIVIGASVDLSSSVILRLAEHNISLIIIHARKPEQWALLNGILHHDAWRRNTQYQVVNNAEACKKYAIDLVRTKLSGQYRVLRACLKIRLDQRRVLTAAMGNIKQAIDHLDLAKEGKEYCSLDHIRGVEGAAARAYFSAYTQVFSPSLCFTGRNRRPPRDPVNVALSLSYTLVHGEAHRGIIAAGLDPDLGFFHTIDYGRPSLACDLIELLRPAVDLWVWQLFREGHLRLEHFNQQEQSCMLGKAGREHFYAAWSKFVPIMARRVRMITRLWIKELKSVEENCEQ